MSICKDSKNGPAAKSAEAQEAKHNGKDGDFQLLTLPKSDIHPGIFIAYFLAAQLDIYNIINLTDMLPVGQQHSHSYKHATKKILNFHNKTY